MSDVVVFDFGGAPPTPLEKQSGQMRLIPSRTTIGFIIGEFIAMSISIPFGMNLGKYDPSASITTFSILMCIWLKYRNISRVYTPLLMREVVSSALFCFWLEVPLLKVEWFIFFSNQTFPDRLGEMISVPAAFLALLYIIRAFKVMISNNLPRLQHVWRLLVAF